MIDEQWCKSEILTETLSWSLEKGVTHDHASWKRSLWLARFILPVSSKRSLCTLLRIFREYWIKNRADKGLRLIQMSRLIDYSFLLEVNI